LSSPDSEGAWIAAALEEHNRKRAAKKKEAERKAREAKEAARVALEQEQDRQPDSKVEFDKGGEGEQAPVPSSGRVATRERVPVPASAAREPYSRLEKMCLRCVKEISQFLDLVCHRFNLASPVCANYDWKGKSCELVGLLPVLLVVVRANRY